MEKKNRLLQLSFVIVVFLALGLTFMRMSGTDTGGEIPFSSRQEKDAPGDRFIPPEAAHRTVESLKNEELLGMPPSAAEGSLGLVPNSKRAQLLRRYGRKGNALEAGGGYSSSAQRDSGRKRAGASVGGDTVLRNVAAPLPSSVRYGGREDVAVNSPSFEEASAAARAGGISFRPNASGALGQNNMRGAAISGVARPTAEETSARTFSPYLTSLTPEAAASLKRQLTGLSSRVERAVLQAMLPKSRKDANIEKYLKRNSSYSDSSSPFASVANQMNAQKAGIMNSMNGAFGKEAADEAGKVMDAYQKELLGALSQPGLTQDQAAQKARAIGAKYEKELEKVGQKHALKDFKEQREAKDSTFQNQLAQAYGADISAQAGEILAAWREKDMQLALAGLPEEEYYKQQLDNQRALRKDLEHMLLQNGKSLQGLQGAENEMERLRVAQALKEEEEGKTLPKEHHFDEKTIAAVSADLQRERREKLDLAEQIYGETGGAAVSAIYDLHESRMNEVMHSNLPFTAKQKKMMEIRQDTNAQIEALQKSPEMREAREQGQVNSTMAKLMQDPGMANASPEEKEAFERLARPVLQDMFHRMNELSETDLPDDEKQRRIAALQERAQRQLGGGSR